MLEVVAGVGDDGELAGVLQHVAEPERELGAADAAGERHVARISGRGHRPRRE